MEAFCPVPSYLPLSPPFISALHPPALIFNSAVCSAGPQRVGYYSMAGIERVLWAALLTVAAITTLPALSSVACYCIAQLSSLKQGR